VKRFGTTQTQQQYKKQNRSRNNNYLNSIETHKRANRGSTVKLSKSKIK
jgi:hypothetical protein